MACCVSLPLLFVLIAQATTGVLDGFGIRGGSAYTGSSSSSDSTLSRQLVAASDAARRAVLRGGGVRPLLEIVSLAAGQLHGAGDTAMAQAAMMQQQQGVSHGGGTSADEVAEAAAVIRNLALDSHGCVAAAWSSCTPVESP